MILQGRIAIVTGAGSGIGQAGSEAMAREGATVIVTDRDLDAARGTVDSIAAAGGRGEAIRVDVTDDAAVVGVIQDVADRHGRIDILHNHAGVQVAGSVEEIDGAGFDHSWAVNVHAQFVACQAVLPVMKRQRGGVILNTSSNSGVFLDRAMTAYITSKAASITMTRQIALDVARYGIRINSLCPGWVDTPFNEPYTDQLGGRKALEHAIANIVPMGRFATTDEIAEVILFMVSDKSSYMTGHALVADGGESLAGGTNSGQSITR
ncbi:MAG: SDR family oxidoreductase [Mesorhizobium sp.]|uniref:SDR family NAD(P)-dependent oxidoreductase n=1 Tax=Mesorhizobium sp. TaxID=1871066 RepID=UPI000FE55EEE|nr:SDR family NAD(P)-dependent oxidoreductase [Mesorhizobium sp.]RWO56893.1 MAG: SDR family oxidoreductase [Mesorhizobium sp.]TIL59958.1 MAG: SDR family oxidoreductase [Mesorhizobium sp.]